MSKPTEGSVLLNVEKAQTGPVKTPALWLKIRENRETMTLVACAMFMVCSATMLIVNKLVVKHFHTPCMVVLAQNAMACGFCVTLLRKSVRFGSRADAVRFAKVVPLMYTGMLCTSAIAQQFASLGLQIVIRNLAPLVRGRPALARTGPTLAWGSLHPSPPPPCGCSHPVARHATVVCARLFIRPRVAARLSRAVHAADRAYLQRADPG